MSDFYERYFESNCVPATYVTLVGQIVVCGFNTRSLDASRDLCALHLHLKTGGVFVKRNDSMTYLNASVISHVDLDANYEGQEKRAAFERIRERAMAPLNKAEAMGLHTYDRALLTSNDWEQRRKKAQAFFDTLPEEDEGDNESQDETQNEAKPDDEVASDVASREDEILKELAHTIRAQDAAKARKPKARRKTKE